MVAITHTTNTTYTGMNADQTRAVDEQAARQLTEMGGKLEDGNLVLPDNVRWEFSNDTFALTGPDNKEAFFKKETYDKYVRSLSGGVPAATSQENDALIDTSRFAGGLSQTSADMLRRLFPSSNVTSELHTNRLSAAEQGLLGQALNKAGTLGFTPTSQGWTLQGVRDSLVALEHPDVKGSTFPDLGPAVRPAAKFSTSEAMDTIQVMNRNVASAQAGARREDAVRASIVGLDPRNAITEDTFVGYLRAKGVSDAEIDKTFKPIFQAQLDRYDANRKSYYGAQGLEPPAWKNDVVYAADLSRDPTIMASWPV